MSVYTVADLLAFLSKHNRMKATLAIRSNIGKGNFSETVQHQTLAGVINAMGNWSGTREGQGFWQDLSNHVGSLAQFLETNQPVRNPKGNPANADHSLDEFYMPTPRSGFVMSEKELLDLYSTRYSRKTTGTFIAYGTSGTSTTVSNG